MKLILDAIQYGNEKHAGQIRKGSGDAYITHPIAVSYIIAAYKRSKKLPELLAAAILHDTLEDTDATFIELATRFTPLVASLVLELTNDEEQIAKVGKLEYQKKKLVSMSSYALIVKLADRMHNVSDQPSEKMIVETLDLMRHLTENRKLTQTHLEMVKEIVCICNERI
ncbi:MAG TPA: HD domain-containing protein [Methanosarcina sp.]|nr:HD domain-containing protein [Methanosarcina sp.]